MSVTEQEDADKPNTTTAPLVRSVSEIVELVRVAVATAGPGRCLVRGTLQSWKRSSKWASGELIEYGDDGETQIARIVVGMRPVVASLAERQLAELGAQLGNGTEVCLFGTFEINARFQTARFVATQVDANPSVGRVEQARDVLIQQLLVEGAFDANGKRPMNRSAVKIGVIHPATGGAGWSDFRTTLERSSHEWQLRPRPVGMLGDNAAQSIALSIDAIGTNDIELLIILRGGGAGSELSVFDSGHVTRAIARCPVPVIVAVGHSVDQTIADRSAAVSLATPTAAAEWLIDGRSQAHALDPAKEVAIERELAQMRDEVDAASRRAVLMRVRQRQLVVLLGCAAVLLLWVLLR